MSEPISIVAITRVGLSMARRIAGHLPGAKVYGYRKRTEDADVEFDEVAPTLTKLFREGHAIVAIMSAGIVVRILGGELADKHKEPPVLVVSEDGQSIVPLLGGHHGANELARRLATHLEGHAALTTTGDTRLGVALDAPPKGWRLANPEDYKAFAGALFSGEAVQIQGKLDWLSMTAVHTKDTGRLRITATSEVTAGSPTHLVYHPARLAVGVGCERGTSAEELSSLVHKSLADAGLSPLAVGGIFSLDLKSDEPAIHVLAEQVDVEARFFEAAVLERQTPRLATPSDIVFKAVGCHGVSESAALEAVGANGQLLVTKRKSRRATCAIAECREPLDTRSLGRRRGHLMVVGLGPGRRDWRSDAVAGAIARADDLVGYSGYLDQVESHGAQQIRHPYPLGEEQRRVEEALDLAADGRVVALVCSGDPGVYAMASLVFESLDRQRRPDWSRVQIEVLPGISAMQAAAARAGAPLGHDFCAISLSDLLTPWAVIEARVKSASVGDFVMAFYNPRSHTRTTQLERALAIVKAHRPAETPVVVAKNLGRDGEIVTFHRLDTFDCTVVDMLSVVLVGASSTKTIELGERQFVYTPRGYGDKSTTEVA